MEVRNLMSRVRWLDAARYADTNGYQRDDERYMWRWRDWVIEAFNRNLPYDTTIRKCNLKLLIGLLLTAGLTKIVDGDQEKPGAGK